ncbi:hydroxymethylbilane synthase [Meiothermus sp.]|uniref:hydroxymethylbilane synthase n=1 Tax=Meiothermus sp. TaxID=1955249 RepID=UPI0021DD0F3D|nr:hydroxymethylbilane synthase [Meiothermus sp.]GIW32839.1 MAG: porphobilinogen deaminase [Meiothermus sp.]
MVSVRIATRGSRLALWQAGWVKEQLERQGARVELVVVETQGDRVDLPFAQMQGQGFFTKAIQDAVLRGEADLAVHSYKDLPSARPEGLEVAAIPPREDPLEVLLVRPEALDEQANKLPLRAGALVGTSAVRRQAQIQGLRPDLSIRELRGNVPTRVEKLKRGEYEAILLAHAGLKRLGLDLSGLYAKVLPPTLVVPAPAQGALALECRLDDLRLKALLQSLDDPQARRTVSAERGLMQKLAGGCQLALGAWAQETQGGLALTAWYGGQLYRALSTTPEAVAEMVFRQIRTENPEVVCESP